MTTIYLIGFMGSGKSTIGVELAKKLSKTYVDTDQYIVEKHQREIAEIFQTDGERSFRNFEIDALREVSPYEVVSTGGGIVEKAENLQTMKNNGVIVYLHTSFQEIYNRLENDLTRPLWDSDIEDKKKLYYRRIPLYKEYADHIIDTDGKLIEELIVEIEEFINHT
jgi:shikimate kinase